LARSDRGAAAPKRPQHDKDRGGRHQGENEPQRHGAVPVTALRTAAGTSATDDEPSHAANRCHGRDPRNAPTGLHHGPPRSAISKIKATVRHYGRPRLATVGATRQIRGASVRMKKTSTAERAVPTYGTTGIAARGIRSTRPRPSADLYGSGNLRTRARAHLRRGVDLCRP